MTPSRGQNLAGPKFFHTVGRPCGVDLAILSDTHVPTREQSIPEPFRDRIAAADRAIHAGDVESPELLADLRELTDVTAVHGNADGPELGLPAVAEVSVGDLTLVVTHGTSNLVQRAVHGTTGGSVLTEDDWNRAIADVTRARTRSWDGDGVIGVGGHTHEVVDTVFEGVRLLNPGTATGAAPADRATIYTATVASDSLDVTLHEH